MKKWIRKAVFECECKNCKTEFESKSPISLFCTPECRIEFNVKKKSNEEKIPYITCQVCKRSVFNVVGSHMRKYHPDYTADRYHSEFPGHPVFSEHTMNGVKAGSIKAGALMREPERREHSREMMKGENNPMHRSKVSEKFRKSISPFSAEFYLKRNPEMTIEEAQKLASDKTKYATDRIVTWTQMEYWISRGMSEGDAKERISNLQKTFSLEICIEKHGEEEGTRIWTERQAKWIKNYKKNNFSMVSQELFQVLWEIIKYDFNDVYFATLNEDKEIFTNTEINHEYRLVLPGKTLIPDFFIESKKLVIEFDGIYWHDHNRRNKPENQLRESKRDESLINNGYRVLRVNEKEWKESKEETIDRCIDFIYAENT
jgi:very-short-patch-repair endonuclease